MDFNPLIFNDKVARLNDLQDEENCADEYLEQREDDRIAEYNRYLQKKHLKKKAQQDEDYKRYKFFEAEKVELDLAESKSQRRRDQRLKDLRNLAEIEEEKRNDELVASLRTLNIQGEYRQQQRLKEIKMEGEARRDRIQDYQESEERNLIRENNRLAGLNKLAVTWSECQQNVFDAQARKMNKQMELMEEKKNFQRAIRDDDFKRIHTLDNLYQQKRIGHYNYKFTPIDFKNNDEHFV